MFAALFGTDIKTFNFLSEGIEDDITKPKDCDKREKLAAVLMCLKLGNSYEAIGALWNVHPNTISNWFQQVIAATAKLSIGAIHWWTKEEVQSTMPPECKYVQAYYRSKNDECDKSKNFAQNNSHISRF